MIVKKEMKKGSFVGVEIHDMDAAVISCVIHDTRQVW